jgi:hypothetical protein
MIRRKFLIAGGSSMQVSSVSRAVLAALLSGALACSADRIQSPPGSALSPGPASLSVVDQNSPTSDEWFVEGDVTQASNGDQITLDNGTGTLGIHPKTATGGGTFVSTAGAIGSGNWIVTELLSFQSYGPGTFPGLPAGSNSGRAQFRVQLTPTGAAFVLEGILTVECNIPGSTVPASTEEGFTLVVPGVANFNDPVIGNTLFIKTS